jgi:S-adenosyl-L-methionine hydrolase (adenosine-forming)
MTTPFRPCGLVTLTTDFGHKGPYVACMKGVILSRDPALRIIDLSHETEVHWPAEAGFWLERSFRWFPIGTVHLAVVDPGVGTGRDIIVAQCQGHVFLAPDNGLLGSMLTRERDVSIVRLDFTKLGALGLSPPSSTFHGRDIFAPLGADLASGKRRPASLGEPIVPSDLVPSWLDDPEVTSTQIRGRVVTFDHFGNVITNVDGALLEQFDRPWVRIGGREIPVRRTYGEAEPGEYLALINSFDVLEVARAEGSARAGLGAERGAPIVIFEHDA